MFRHARIAAAAVACWAGFFAGTVGAPQLPVAAIEVPIGEPVAEAVVEPVVEPAVDEAGLDAPVLPPDAPAFGETSRARMARTAIFFSGGDQDGYLDGGVFVLPVPLPWPPGTDSLRSWDLDVPAGAPISLLAAVSPAKAGFLPGAVSVTIDGAPVSSPERFAVGGLQLPEAEGLQEYAALDLVTPAFEPGRHTVAVACNGCTPAASNQWLSTINAGPRTYALNVLPSQLQWPGNTGATPFFWPISTAGGAASGPGTESAGVPRRGLLVDCVFYSDALGREMPYRVYLPPGYDDPGPDGQPAARRYATLYLLHGLDAGMKQWTELGLGGELDRLAARGETIPFIVVMPAGRAGYWVNHADGGPRWGDYVAKDLVAHVDATYRTVPQREARAIGGISMGGHGALQLTLNNPDVFGTAGAHSPSMRLRAQAPPFLGGFFVNAAGGPGQAAYEARDPISLVRQSASPKPPAIWIDIGDRDPWAPRARELHAALLARGWVHEWQPAAGEHAGSYWQARLPDYVRFYRQALLPFGS